MGLQFWKNQPLKRKTPCFFSSARRVEQNEQDFRPNNFSKPPLIHSSIHKSQNILTRRLGDKHHAALSKDLNSYLEPQQVNQVVKAYHFADEAHEGQKRKSGEPYITHPLAVAKILAEMHMDHQCLMAALLHDVIEDTSIPKHTLGQEFDDEVAELVDGVSKLKIVFQSRAEAEAENFQKMTLAMAKDIRVILVKLADRLHNMRTLGYLNPEKAEG